MGLTRITHQLPSGRIQVTGLPSVGVGDHGRHGDHGLEDSDHRPPGPHFLPQPMCWGCSSIGWGTGSCQWLWGQNCQGSEMIFGSSGWCLQISEEVIVWRFVWRNSRWRCRCFKFCARETGDIGILAPEAEEDQMISGWSFHPGTVTLIHLKRCCRVRKLLMSWMEGAELRYTIRLEAAHLLLETEVDCAARSDGETPSYIAAQQGHVEMVW